MNLCSNNCNLDFPILSFNGQINSQSLRNNTKKKLKNQQQTNNRK